MTQRRILTNLLETSERLNIPARWLKEAAISGKVPCLRISSRKLLFEPNAVEKAIADMASAPVETKGKADGK